MKEQRRLERFDLRVPATVEVVAQGGESEKKIHYVITKNISADGAFFETMSPAFEGAQVKVGLVLNLGRSKGLTRRRAGIKVSGTVLRSESSGMAIRFDKSYRIIPLNNT
jgi:hypothetical protein